MIYVFAESTASILLGALLVQLVAEPAPISSSTHVRIFLDWVGVDTVPHLFVALLMASAGMLLLLLCAYRYSLKKCIAEYWSPEGFWFCVHIFWTTLLIPGALVAKTVVALPESTPVRLMMTAMLLIGAEFFSASREKPTLRDTIMVGIAQSLALYCGTSRLATTYMVGRARGLSGSSALGLSWAVAIPFYAGTGFLGLIAMIIENPGFFTLRGALLGMAALMCGYGMLRLVMASAARERMGWWAIYLVPLSVITALLHAA